MTVQPDPLPGSTPKPPKLATDRVMTVRSMAIGAALFVSVAVAAGFLLLFFYGTQAAAPQLEAIKTASTIVLGAGGAVALILAARRQRSAELTLQENARIAAENAADRAKDLKQREDAAKDIRLDAIERRITDLYTKAADQLGNDKASVRLAGLYALERLAQDNPSQRQTIVNVICAHLRMPFERYPKPGESESRQVWQFYWAAEQERQVRLAAQEILLLHLKVDKLGSGDVSLHWRDIDINLSGAHLEGFRLIDSSARNASFVGSHFAGYTCFDLVRFEGYCDFSNAEFLEPIRFSRSTFGPGATAFWDTSFWGMVTFSEVRFKGILHMNGVNFKASSVFSNLYFDEAAHLLAITFTGDTFILECAIAVVLEIQDTVFHDIMSIKDNVGELKFSRTTCNSKNKVASALPEGWRLVDHNETGMLSVVRSRTLDDSTSSESVSS